MKNILIKFYLFTGLLVLSVYIRTVSVVELETQASIFLFNGLTEAQTTKEALRSLTMGL